MISRRNVVKNGLMGLSALALGTLAEAQMSSRYGIEGQFAPELDIEHWIDREGNPATFTLADHPDKWVFLKCFQSWCPGCYSHGLPALKQISEALIDNPKIAFAAIQTVFEGYSPNTRDKVRKTQLQYDLKMPVGHDPGNEQTGTAPSTMISYRTGGTPWMILISPERRVIYNIFNINAEKAIEFLKQQTA